MNEIELTQELVRINSENPPGNEKQIAKFIYDYLNDLKIPAEIMEFEKNRFNVVGVICKGEGLMLNGHLDTVPAGNVNNWKYSPFDGKIVGNKLYGLGTSDMKGAIAAMMTSLKNLKMEDLKRKLLLAFVSDEEVNFKGSIYLIKKRKDLIGDVNYGVIGEPSELNVGIANKGIVDVKVKFLGKAAHGSTPWRGDNAILKAMKFVQETEKLSKNFKIKDSLLGKGTINIGKIMGGTKINMVPDFCEIEVDRRLVPGETPKMALKQFKNILKKMKINAKMELNNARLPLKLSEKSKIVKLVQEATNGKLVMATGYNEAELYYRDAGMGCVVFGPGTGKCAHAPNEYIEIPKLKKSVKIYEQIIKKWCC